MQCTTLVSRAACARGPVLAVAVGALLLAACGRQPDSPPASGATATTAASSPSAADATAGAGVAASPAGATAPVAWRPDALDELLAPIALYPDALLGQILAASVTPQEVLDGGNWLLQNQNLKGKALDQAAEQAGFGTAMRALFAFPEVVDMMCQNLDWTTQLGEAFNGDQKAVLESVQRLRTRAINAGTFKSTPQQKVETQTVAATGGAKKQVVVVEPANPQVVYVPKYDPAAVYQAPPSTVINNNVGTPGTTAATATTTTSGPTTGDVVTAGLIGFGAGILIAEIFDDDDWDDYYRPSWGYGGVYYGGRPWYGNTYVYAPTYVGYRPAGGYYPPANYPNRWDRPNNNIGNDVNININNGNYFDRFPNNPNRPVPATRPVPTTLPAATSRPNQDLARVAEPRDLDRPKVQGTYAGAKPGAAERPAIPTSAPRVPGQLDGKLPATRDVPGGGLQAGTRDKPAGVSRPQGEYAGAKPRPAERPSPAAAGTSRDLARPAPDRGYGQAAGGLDRAKPKQWPAQARPAPQTRPAPQARPAPETRPMPQTRPAAASRGPQPSAGGAFAGAANRGGASLDRAASARGRASMGSGARPAPRGR